MGCVLLLLLFSACCCSCYCYSGAATGATGVDTGDNQEEQADRSLELHIDRAVHAQDAHELASQTISRQSAMYQVIMNFHLRHMRLKELKSRWIGL